MKVLLHCCCGPCASSSLPALKDMGHEATLFFANSNIDTREEFERRLAEAEKLAAAEGVSVAVLDYDHEEWLREVASGFEHEPERAGRCARCFKYNLAKAREYAAANGFDAFATTLSVSPHKDSRVIFKQGESVAGGGVEFLPVDFKKNGGFLKSVERARELGMYRQDYCGCEFSKERWSIHHKMECVSTNLDARAGKHRDVFTADFQSAGRGRLDHKWHSPPGAGLLMSAVLSVEGMPAADVCTLPLVAGLAVVKALEGLCIRCGLAAGSRRIAVKWPNDVLVDGRKISGILCERHADNVIVGIGVNVLRCGRPDEIAGRAVSLEEVSGCGFRVVEVRNAVLAELGRWYGIWRERGFAAVHPEIAAADALAGKRVGIFRTDSDLAPSEGICTGIAPDGALVVGCEKIYAGEARVCAETGGVVSKAFL